MNLRLQILVSMILHVATFVLLGLGSIYGIKLLTGGALVSLMFGLFFSKEALDTADTAAQIVVDIIDDDDDFSHEDTHLIDILRERLD